MCNEVLTLCLGNEKRYYNASILCIYSLSEFYKRGLVVYCKSLIKYLFLQRNFITYQKFIIKAVSYFFSCHAFSVGMFFSGHWLSPNVHKSIVIPVVFRHYLLIIAGLLFYLRNKFVIRSIIIFFSWNRKDKHCFYTDPFRNIFIGERIRLCGELTRHFGCFLFIV